MNDVWIKPKTLRIDFPNDTRVKVIRWIYSSCGVNIIAKGSLGTVNWDEGIYTFGTVPIILDNGTAYGVSVDNLEKVEGFNV